MGDAPNRHFRPTLAALPRIQENAIKHSSRRSAVLAQLKNTAAAESSAPSCSAWRLATG